MSKYHIEAKGLSKIFAGNKIAVNKLNLQVKQGSVFGLLGRNGCGKTTTLKMLMGLLHSNEGSAQILGHDFFNAPYELRQQVAYVSQKQQLHDWMSPRQLLAYCSHFYSNWNKNYALEIASNFSLDLDLEVGAMSGGQQRKVAVMLALASMPKVLLLDEPAAGMDPISRRELIDELIGLLTKLEDCTILLSTHLLGDLERLADSIGVMQNGHLSFCEDLETIQSSFRRVQVIFNSPHVPEGFKLPGQVKAEMSGPVINALLKLDDPCLLDAVREMPGVRIMEHPVNLEECFVEYLGQENPYV